VRILWDSGACGLGGGGVTEYERNLINTLRERGHHVDLFVDDNLSRRPQFKLWKPPTEGYIRLRGKIVANNIREFIDIDSYDVQIGNSATMYPMCEKFLPIVYDLNLPSFPDHARNLRWALAGQLKKTSVVCTTTNFIRKEITSRFPETNVEVILGGSKLAPIEPTETPREKPYLVYWGNRLSQVPNKNFAALLKTLPYHHLDLRVSGFRGVPPEELKLIEELGIQDRVIYYDGLNDQELVNLISGATMYVCPSKYEGLGLPAVEALSKGVPVVVTPMGSLPEVTNGSAYIAESYRSKDLLKAIQSVLADPQGTASRVSLGKLWSQEWTWDKTTDKIEKTLQTYFQ
jgi:glycosyltransferase involved in cell wall biosynthesis